MVTPAQFVQEVLLTRVFVQIQMILAAVLLPVQAMLGSRARATDETPAPRDVIARSKLLLMKPRAQKREGQMVAERLPFAVKVSLLPKSAVPVAKLSSPPAAEAVAPASLERQAQGPRAQAAAQAAVPAVDEEVERQRRVSAAHQALVALGQAAGPEAEGFLREFAELNTRAEAAERMLAQAAAEAPPAESDAFRWHEVAQTTLRWSLTEVQKRKRALEVQLVELAERASPPAAHSLPKKAAPASVAYPNPPCLPDRSMRQDLESLRRHDPARLLIVRKIKRLGWNSASIIRECLGHFGEVADVLICHSMSKPNPKRPAGRTRPAALGFVVMGSPAAANAVLEDGLEHVANGVVFEVKAFDPFESDSALEAACSDE